jgi:MGT family glycosyltransferase
LKRIVYLTPPAHGHLNPALPVMRELARRGMGVTGFNTEEFRAQIEHAGATFRPYPATDLSAAAMSAVLEHGNLANATRLILRASEQLAPFLIEELARDRPDLVVFDSIALWGRIAATHLRLPAAASISHLVMDERHLKKLDLLRMLWQHLPKLPGILASRGRLVKRFGSDFPAARPLFPMRDRLNLVFTTRNLQPDTPIVDETFHFVGPSIDPETRREVFPLDTLGPGPVVYVSMGTVHALQPELFRTLSEAFAAVRAQFIVSTGRLGESDLGAIPANFIVRRSVPQLEVLKRADVFVTHAGINSVHEALYFGVPMVLVPHQFEQLLNARVVASHGAGIVVESRVRRRPIGAAALRQALEATLGDSRYRAAAEGLMEAMRSAGGYREAADLLQAYLSAADGKGSGAC